MIRHMTTGRMVELVLGLLVLGAGIYFYRRRDPTADKADHYGAQGAVIMFVVAAIMLAHSLGAFDYRPSAAEADAMKSRAQ